MRTVGIIPARYASSRFPGKPLALIRGRMLIEHVWRRASRSRELDRIIVATDDERIAEAVRGFGGEAVMTSPKCASGSDRLAEVARSCGKNDGYFINIQGDEPLISPALIDRLALLLRRTRSAAAVTACYPLKDAEAAADPNVVKVVCDRNGRALYFSRSLIPYPRLKGAAGWFKHIGIYGYRREILLRFTSWPQTPLEKTEQLEQLRILENGHSIYAVVSPRDSSGVDVPGDVKKIERLLK